MSHHAVRTTVAVAALSLAALGLPVQAQDAPSAAQKLVDLRASAEAGDADAQTNLGYRYFIGWGVQEDDVEAVAWYRLAAEQGHAGAQVNLGVMYANGLGVPEDDVEAVAWYRLAARGKSGSPKVHVGPELAEGAPGGPVTGAFPGFSLGVLVMGQGPVEARGKRAVFSKARWARLCVRGAGSFHRACPFVTSGPRGALLHLPRVQLVKSICPYDLRCTCVIFQPERWGPNSQTLAPLRVRAHRGDHAL